MILALAILSVGWSSGAAAQQKPPPSSAASSSAAPRACEVCVTRAEWEIAELDAAKADRFDRLQVAHTACDVERLELRGARAELQTMGAACGERERAALAALERARLELETSRARERELARQRWIFAAGGAGVALALTVIAALAIGD